MAPKRRRDAVAREIAKTYTFGRSQIDKTDVESLVKNRMVGAGRAPGREIVPRPWDNEVVIFRDLLYAGLRFPPTPRRRRHSPVFRHLPAPTHSKCRPTPIGVHVDMSDYEDQAFR
jgi:hypothetical protein